MQWDKQSLFYKIEKKIHDSVPFNALPGDYAGCWSAVIYKDDSVRWKQHYMRVRSFVQCPYWLYSLVHINISETQFIPISKIILKRDMIF